MDNEKIAAELVKAAKELMAEETGISVYRAAILLFEQGKSPQQVESILKRMKQPTKGYVYYKDLNKHLRKPVTAAPVKTKYNYSTEKKAKVMASQLRAVSIVVKRLSKLDSFSHNDEAKVHAIYDRLADITSDLGRIGT